MSLTQAPEEQPSSPLSSTGRRVLVADDDHVTFALLTKLLSSWGYDVVAVRDGHEAMALLNSPDAPQMAILDWMMPGTTGTEIIRSIRHDHRPYIYALLLTSKDSQDDFLQGLSAGADDYLVKPVRSKELQARLLVGERILKLQEALLSAYTSAQFQADHDVLTGLHNRAAILEVLHRELERSVRDGRAVGVILADIDHFKMINDTHGHGAGDAVLRAAAAAMQSCLRPYDSIGRYGGEEFLAVVPNCPASTVMNVAERIRRTIEDLTVDTEAAGIIRLSASFGVAIANAAHQSEAAVIDAADRALYMAKHRGRNRVEFSVQPVEPADASAAAGVRKVG
jgi:two-component system cell cycle response regulator